MASQRPICFISRPTPIIRAMTLLFALGFPQILCLGADDETESAQSAASPRLPAVDKIVEAGMHAQKMRGAVVLIGQGDHILHRSAYGLRAVKPVSEAMTIDTIFDLASLTKPIATATSVMILAERSKLKINAPVSQYLPEFAAHGKSGITIHHLLTHTSGLIADNSIKDYKLGKEEAWQRICQLSLLAKPGEKFIYSDVGFIVLGFLVERVSQQSLDQFTKENIFAPMGMTSTEYCPPKSVRTRCAPTERRDGEWIRGVVHDPRAYALGGVAGHAGLFSTADDLSRFAKMICQRGKSGTATILRPKTVDLLLLSRTVPNNHLRTWGWDRQSPYSSNRGKGWGERSIGHGGFTGTGLWIDPDRQLYVVFLSSRLHPDGDGRVNSLIGQIGTVAAAAADGKR